MEKAKRIGVYSDEALQKARWLTMEALGNVKARRGAGKRDLTAMFEREDTKRRLAGFGRGKAKI